MLPLTNVLMPTSAEPNLTMKNCPLSPNLSHLLNIDESRGLTLPSQNQRNYNQHANAARQQFHRPTHRPTFQKQFTPRQHQALSSILRPYTQQNSSSNRPPIRPQSNQNQHSNRPNNHQNNRRNAPPPRPNHGNRPPLRPTSSNSNNQRRPQSNSTPFRPNPSPNNATNIVCNNCGRTGHYARQCPTATNRPQNTNNRNGGNPRSPTNNENTAPRNHRAYFVTDSSSPHAETTHYHQAFLASSNTNPVFNNGPPTIWPDTNLPQMEINPSLTDNDFVPSMSHSPPSTDAIEYFPDDPMSAYQRFGPPDLDNWLLTVVPQVTTLLFSVISMMLNPAMYLFPLLMEPPRYPLSKAQLTVSLQPQKDRKLSLVLLMFTTLKVLVTVCFP
ncbi:hypothetical protein MHU86_24733 [Fragilaria crotonensis]|nr:hypothetical protein MHU86_24733 [Fragilaria crotonensis]